MSGRPWDNIRWSHQIRFVRRLVRVRFRHNERQDIGGPVYELQTVVDLPARETDRDDDVSHFLDLGFFEWSEGRRFRNLAHAPFLSFEFRNHFL